MKTVFDHVQKHHSVYLLIVAIVFLVLCFPGVTAGKVRFTPDPEQPIEQTVADFNMSALLKAKDNEQIEAINRAIQTAADLESSRRVSKIEKVFLSLLVMAVLALAIWGIICLCRISIKRGHFRFILSLSFLPGILYLLCSAIFSPDTLDEDSFMSSLIVGFACVWVLYALWIFGLRSFPDGLKK